MAKRKRIPAARSKPRAPRAAQPGAELKMPKGMAEMIARQLEMGHTYEGPGLLDPLGGAKDADERLRQALEVVGIDPRVAAQPDPFLVDAWRHHVHTRTDAARLVALAVAHAEDARACARGDMPSKALRDDVLCTVYLQRNRKPPEGLKDDRRPLVMDGEIVTLLHPADDARAVPITVKLPRVIVERLRDAVHAMAPARTISGIAAMGITMVLDVLEAEHIKHTGHGFPKMGGKVLEGGRPSRTRATTAEQSRPSKKPRKQAKRPQ